MGDRARRDYEHRKQRFRLIRHRVGESKSDDSGIDRDSALHQSTNDSNCATRRDVEQSELWPQETAQDDKAKISEIRDQIMGAQQVAARDRQQ